MNVIKHIICELTGYRPGSVDVSQGDRGSRAVSCRLMENGAPWMIPEGAMARVAYTLPDGTEGLYDRRPDGSPMWEITKNIVTVELADQLMAQAGMVVMSILIIGPEGGQLATWPIRVMVIADSPARLTVPEAMPPYGAGFAGKIFFGGEDGTVTPLGIGDGVAIVQQGDGTFALVAYGGSGGGGGITEEKDPTVYEWAKQPQKPTYTAEEVGALPKDTKIPGKTSELTNDAGFVTKAVSDLANYYTKVQTQELIAAIPRFRVTVVQQLPAAGEELVLYLVPFATAEGQYLEYIWVDGRWEIIGSQRVDLTGYATEVWVKDYVAEHTGQNLTLDTTLTQSGKAADAKATGDEIKRVVDLIDGLSTEKLDASKLQEAINTALAQAKANGEFDGAAATFEITGATALAYGAAPTVTETSGSTEQARKYVVGIPQGAPGYTPKPGTDYWTDEDQEAIVQQVIAALGTPVFGRVDEDCKITLTGELVDGKTYTFAFVDEDGGETVIGTYTKNNAPDYTNQIAISTDADGNVYNGTGYKVGYRLNSNGEEDQLPTTATNPAFITGFIPIKTGDVVLMKDCYIDTNNVDKTSTYGKPNWSLYTSYFTSDRAHKIKTEWNNMLTSKFMTDLVLDAGGYCTGFTFTGEIGSNSIAYIRLCLAGTPETAVVTINEAIE